MIAFYILTNLNEEIYRQTYYDLHLISRLEDENTGEASNVYESIPLGDCNTLDINPQIKQKFERYGSVLI